MTTLQHAQALGAAGFHVFPIAPGTKTPMHKGWQDEATRTPAQWPDGANVGIFCERFGDDQAIVAVDVDRKNGKNGDEALFALEIEGHELPPTFEQRTPTGGSHLIFVSDRPVAPSVSKIGRALDIRSAGSYIVGPGSILPEGVYEAVNRIRPVSAPAWLLERAGAPATRAVRSVDGLTDLVRAQQRGAKYLKTAPRSVKGDGGDQTAYIVASKLKDLGCDRTGSLMLMMSSAWDDGCGWSEDRLREKIDHAWLYGKEAPGIAAPETVFTVVEPADAVATDVHPFAKINSEFAFVIAGGGSHILWETTDPEGLPTLEHLSEDAFHKRHASMMFASGDKVQPLTRAWMVSPDRREFDGLTFSPGGCHSSRFYNVFRGWSVEPADTADHPAVRQWIEHARINVCGSDDDLFRWLVGFFAHLIQRPDDKPLVALVFQGGKGVGKNALVERVGHLLGGHFLIASNRRYLTGNFNGHLERCLMLGLDEAFWSGDKQTEGIVKDLITGSHHVIEHKGKEPYRIRNLTRTVIMGNEDWIVPASHDERRFAVFKVGDGRKQDRDFFESMRLGMEAGGYAHLLRYLLDFPVSDVNAAPVTEGLQDQKRASLDIFDQWWLDCLSEGAIVQSDFGSSWPTEMSLQKLMAAFRRYAKDSNVRNRFDSAVAFGKKIHKVAPSIQSGAKVPDPTGGGRANGYKNMDLSLCRADWNAYMKSEWEWTA